MTDALKKAFDAISAPICVCLSCWDELGEPAGFPFGTTQVGRCSACKAITRVAPVSAPRRH